MIARITIDDTTTHFNVDDAELTVPCGARQLRERHLTADPPLPEDLTNAIGEMQDHLDDALREMPALAQADTYELRGEAARIIAAIEYGRAVTEPSFALTREAAEDVFRTVATESAADRAHNPGLPAAFVDSVVGGCCAVVALMRGLHLDVAQVHQ
jgi:exopolyphosphatase / guanosine-5'-triphosphate,3'-diphosphate pyrophosphatase